MINSMNGKSSFELNNLGSLISYRLLTLTIICIQMANEMFGSRCVRVAVENQFFRISNRERERKKTERRMKSRLFLFFSCAFLLPSSFPLRLLKDPMRAVKFFPITSLSPLFFLSLSRTFGTCVYIKKCV